jgi:hypothetical protein
VVYAKIVNMINRNVQHGGVNEEDRFGTSQRVNVDIMYNAGE